MPVRVTDAARHQAALIGAPEKAEEIQRLLDNPQFLMRIAGQQKFRVFIERAWPHIEPQPFVGNWHIDAIAEHLQAVSDGQIKRLLINVPPRTSKSTVTSIMWPCWTWAQDFNPALRLKGPHVRFVFASYAQPLGIDMSIASRRLLTSDWYKTNYMRDRFSLSEDVSHKLKFDTSAGGARLVASTDGGVTGRGGDIFAIDDPHSTQGVESDADRENVIRWWRQTVQSRLNDPKSGAFVVIMQRLHEADLSGYILDNSDADWVHLCLPMMHEKARHCVTVVLPSTDGKPWEDPRTEEGELLAPQRFDQKYVDMQAREVGPYVFAGQYQQRPTPAGGEIFKYDWWQDWPHAKYPVFDLLIASVDTAYTEKTENDFSALTIWGVWSDQNGLPQLMLVYAWKDRLQVNDLVQRIAKTCRRPMYPVDRVLIEAKANGISVAQELVRLFGTEDFAVDLIDPKGDKNARALSVQPLFAPSTRIIRQPTGENRSITTDGIVWAPADRAWADMVKSEAASFPKGRHDDLVDSMVQALKWLRESGLAKRREERLHEMVEAQRYTPAVEPLYDV